MNIKESFKNTPSVKIPLWVITALIPVIIALIGFTSYQIKVQQTILNNLDFHDKSIQELKITVADKVGRQEYNELRTYMMRIEDKVDRLIERGK